MRVGTKCSAARQSPVGEWWGRGSIGSLVAQVDKARGCATLLSLRHGSSVWILPSKIMVDGMQESMFRWCRGVQQVHWCEISSVNSKKKLHNLTALLKCYWRFGCHMQNRKHCHWSWQWKRTCSPRIYLRIPKIAGRKLSMIGSLSMSRYNMEEAVWRMVEGRVNAMRLELAIKGCSPWWKISCV